MYEDDDEAQSSFDGKIKEIPEISVDNFDNKSKMAYFLSHMHSDHNQGLFGRNNAERLKSNGAVIYMSEETKTILSGTHWNFGLIEGLVEPLKTGMAYNIDLPDKKSFEVTLIPVTHIIGAVMFLFKTKDNKNILFTGDFMIDKKGFKELKKLHQDNGNPIMLESLYVDSTFNSADYTYFPDREVCHDKTKKKIKEWLEDSKHRVALYSNYQYGYDDLYSAIFQATRVPIYQMPVDGPTNIHKIYRNLYGDKNFMTEDKKNRIHKCKNKNPSDPHGRCGVAPFPDAVYLHIYLSASRGCSYDPKGDQALTQVGFNSYYLCYPTHCSKSQLDEFTKYFKHKNLIRFPTRAIPTPRANTPYKNNDNQDRRGDVDNERVKRRLF